MRNDELMSKPVVTCRQNDTLHTAARLMWEHDCGAIPVTGDDGSLVGIVTDRDICMATYTKGSPPQSLRVADAMSKKVFSARVDDSLDVVERLMQEKQIRRVPIIDGSNRPVGLVSLNDIARYVASSRKNESMEHELTQALAAISQKRAASAQAAAQSQARRAPM